MSATKHDEGSDFLAKFDKSVNFEPIWGLLEGRAAGVYRTKKGALIDVSRPAVPKVREPNSLPEWASLALPKPDRDARLRLRTSPREGPG